MIRQRLKIDTVAGNINLFRTPEEGQLLFDQFFKDFMLLLVETGNVNRLAKEHWLKKLIVFILGKSTVGHNFLEILGKNPLTGVLNNILS
jgi:hypothetical protein